MSSKTVPHAWRRVFLRVLGQGANVRAAALAADIHHSTAYRYRRDNPHFAKLWNDALGTARQAMVQGQVPEELAFADARPRVIRSSKDGKTRVIAVGKGRWSEEVEEKFFTVLAATGNVKEAARQIDMSASTLYNRRKIWPAFDARWDEVISLATERLAVQLLMSASNLLEPPDLPVPDLEGMSVENAIRVAQLYEARRRKNGDLRRYDRKRPPVDVEAVKAEIIRKAELLSRASRR